MDKFTLLDMLVIVPGIVVGLCLLAALVLVIKIKQLVTRAQAENNKLKRENQELRDKIEELTPKPQGQSLVQTGMGLRDTEYLHLKEHFRVHDAMNLPPAEPFGLGNNMQVPQTGRMSKGRPEYMPMHHPAQVPPRSATSIPSSSSVRDVHHRHDDNTLMHVAVAAAVLSSSDDNNRSAPACSPSRDSDYGSPSYDSGDSGSPSCD
ncbi:hypothetical protein D3C79_49360 [compost metagenome]